MKTHILMAVAAAALAASVSLVLATYGAQGTLGFIAVWIGYPGGFVNWKLNSPHVSYALMTAVNWSAYFAFIEAAIAIKRRLLA
jgi:hypothetical protein